MTPLIQRKSIQEAPTVPVSPQKLTSTYDLQVTTEGLPSDIQLSNLIQVKHVSAANSRARQVSQDIDKLDNNSTRTYKITPFKGAIRTAKHLSDADS
jgi:hypothetical protein